MSVFVGLGVVLLLKSQSGGGKAAQYLKFTFDFQRPVVFVAVSATFRSNIDWSVRVENYFLVFFVIRSSCLTFFFSLSLFTAVQLRPIRTCFQRRPGQTSSTMISGAPYSHTAAAISLTDPCVPSPSALIMLWVGWSLGVTTWLMWSSMGLWQACLPHSLACCSEEDCGAYWLACSSPLTQFTPRQCQVSSAEPMKVPPCSSCCPCCVTYVTVGCGAVLGPGGSWPGSLVAWVAPPAACSGRSSE